MHMRIHTRMHATQAFPGARPILDGASANFAYWKKIEEERTQQGPPSG